MENILKSPVTSIKGVGQVRAKQFIRLGIFTVEDVLTHFPRDYENRGTLMSIGELPDKESCSFIGIIRSKVESLRPRAGMTIYRLAVGDETGTAVLIWYNQHYIKNVFHIGERYIFYGRTNRKYKSMEILNPVYEKVSEDEIKLPGIVPVYPSTASLSQGIIRACVGSALEMLNDKLTEIIPHDVRIKYGLSEINYCIRNIHFPKTEEDFKIARYRLVFEELFLLQLSLLSIKNALNVSDAGIVLNTPENMDDFLRNLPFSLTGAQKRVLGEVLKDLKSGKAMSRMVQGDVGSGKTMIAVLALFTAAVNGCQGVMMVPTEILARQHFDSISALLSPYGIRTEVITGSIGKKDKARLLDDLKEGKIHVIIGTHALIEENVQFERLGLVITDEQHRFGVRQRARLAQKGQNPHVLVMTATPIPRTLALILYGDLDISIIDELPPGRKAIETYPVNNSMRDRINSFIRKRVSEGRQVYIVCPLVDDSDTTDAKSAVKTAERIRDKDFSDLRVGLIHGKMKNSEKDEVMQRFVNGNLDILVSTTVIEVGVNVPNAAVMVIENAERFGLAQLHQLRGRVGRGEHQSYCMLYNESKSDVSKKRMNVMKETMDGFIIAEKDLEIRGPGEFFGTRQHGIPELKIANLYRDMDILKSAQKAALEIINEDPERILEKNIEIYKKIEEKFGQKLNGLTF
ncbi:MAG TPA: ATP-dependent DNA helicase RecG [Clostridia bacterium]